MATVKAIVRSNRKNAEVNVRFRVSDGRDIQLFNSSDIKVKPDVWDSKNDCIKARVVFDTEKRNEINRAVIARKQLLSDLYETNKHKTELTSEVLEHLVDETLYPDKYKKPQDNLFDLMELFLTKRRLSKVRENNYHVLIRALKRYELFYQIRNGKPKFNLSVETINSDVIEDFEDFLKNEHILYNKYPNIYKQIPSIVNTKRKCPKPHARGNNTICALFNKLRAFFNWCNEQEITNNRPFDKYNGMAEKYGKPYYISLEERNQIADYDLSKYPYLEVQRDIFVFQCLIGCRVSDLLKMTKDNVIDGAIDYIPHKTKNESPDPVSVPLNDRAKALVKKYEGVDKRGKLFPFISAQKYNDSIKDIFLQCGITRVVTILNPTTGEEEKRPINEVASSHLARRTFVGNLYKKVKDPNLVGALSGHSEGSKAFARYRSIDKDMKVELVNLME
ncbi:phage integrase SAM-like domain-containing protein [Dysgonomonas sp. GY75]|uniref:site-specific integrase n=1 Tax=Dysgonomonas sp. GY75 TaxID=2780419 RepID=UPI0018844713|nr:site-specific integrase [Dysgonomonas sp. GY75]MBF0651361.1 phage integrase SAM-like domain-containing protein [Dysgonomonas sp. GY75]